MTPVISESFTSIVAAVMLGLVLFATRVVQPRWWASPVVRAGVIVTFGGILAGLGLWAVGRAADSYPVVRAGAAVAYVGVLVFFPAAVAMPLAAGIDRGLRWVVQRIEAPSATGAPSAREDTASGPKVSRRAVVRFGGAALPALGALTGASGFVEAQRGPSTPIVRLRYPGLHPDLDGLRILQLSDVHLGACLTLDDLSRGLEKARALRPDLVVLTGDIADDPTLVPEALRLVAQLTPRCGAFASLGNHEYLHDIDVTRPLYESSPVPLLVGTGRTIVVGRATLFVGGADDPVRMSGDIEALLRPSIEAAAASAPAHADFRLLLCHRPEGFGPATDAGFDLTLSGHTHGGQLGLFGRSVLETLKPGVGWWGTYTKRRPTKRGPSHLYTTSGFGHWFPFRVGCPTEMPLLVLESGAARGRAPDRA